MERLTHRDVELSLPHSLTYQTALEMKNMKNLPSNRIGTFARTFSLILFSLSASFAMSASSYEPIPIQAQPADCVLDRHDPYDPGNWGQGRFLRGPHRGECLDTRLRRSIRILSAKERAYYTISTKDPRIAIANFSHAQKFWIALIDPRAIEEVLFQIEYFPAVVPAAHNQLRFIFSERSPVVLIPQKKPHGKRVVLRNLVYSNEAVMKLSGDAFDVWSGLWRNFGLSHRFVSAADQYDAMVVKQGHRVKQISLKLSGTQATDVLRNALRISHDEGMSRLYNTVGKACGTELFVVLDKALGIKLSSIPRRILSHLALSEVLTTEAETALWARKLYQRKVLRPDFDQDKVFLQEWNTLNGGERDARE